MIEVYDKKEKCCGCGLCEYICPKSAIKMKEDEVGFLYPVIDSTRCINCKACKKICAYKEDSLNTIKESYAAVNHKKDVLQQAASGGMFGALAEQFLNKGGCVCGSEMIFEQGHVNVRHVLIESQQDLKKLQGSKYVQSDTSKIFDSITSKLKEGREVLFSGTPCQVAAIKRLVGKKFADKIFTIDIICHGVPSRKMFDDYIQKEMEKQKIIVQEFKFRDKQFGWGLDGSIKGKDSNSNIVFKKINPDTSSYYRFFLDGETYRDSCYECPFAQDKRIGDLTIGDYWGVEKYSPELLNENGGPFFKSKGVSCLFVNTNQGQKLLEHCGLDILRKTVEVSKIKIINTQLREPAQFSYLRKKLFKGYAQNGYPYIEKIFIRKSKISNTKQHIKLIIKRIIDRS